MSWGRGTCQPKKREWGRFQKLDQPPKVPRTLAPLHPTLQAASLAPISLFSTLPPRPHPSQNELWTLPSKCTAMPLHMLAPPSCSIRETPTHPPKAHSQPPCLTAPQNQPAQATKAGERRGPAGSEPGSRQPSFPVYCVKESAVHLRWQGVEQSGVTVWWGKSLAAVLGTLGLLDQEQ